MGLELGRFYHALFNECSWLHLNWLQYRQLYGTSESRLDILNEAAGLFFRIVQDCLWEDTLLHICRLTDPPGRTGRERLSVQRLPFLIDDAELKRKLRVPLERAQSRTKFARDWRNRHIAHADMVHKTVPSRRPLAKASRLKVEVALESIVSVLNTVQLHYNGSTTYYRSQHQPGDAEEMLYALRDGVELERARRQRFEDGRPNPDDLRPPRAV